MTSDPIAPKRALISVSDKEGLVELGRALAAQGIDILSTGGSAKALASAGVAVTEVSEHTGFPEIMDGRVKTLHPKIHGGILARRDLEPHRTAMTDHAIAPIDLVIVNLYPFAATLASGADFGSCVENIDIGGPAMVRAAAKNHDHVAIVTSPSDYPALIDALKAGGTTLAYRRLLAAKAFAHTALYDGMIAGWLGGETAPEGDFAESLFFGGGRGPMLRYGENPHQQAAFYFSQDARSGVANATQHQGKALSYNNLNDTDAALEAVAEFEETAVAIIKHANPCGVALGKTQVEAYAKALACDPTSAFGGIIALNRPLDAKTAEEIVKIFTEVIIAPGASKDAQEVLAQKKNLRLLLSDGLPDSAGPGLVVRSLAGGYLVQSRDNGRIHAGDLKVVTKVQPSPAQVADMIFAFRVAKHVKSNAIVYARDGATIGIGAGQMSRIDSSRIAAWKAKEAFGTRGAQGSVVASDAFFPFADGLLAAAEAGTKAIIQPGGSQRDAEVIAAADEAGLAMVFTGMRHFRH